MKTFVLSGTHLPDRDGAWDIAVASGRVAGIERHIPSDARVAADGMLAFPGFCEAHIHLDKALILDRCDMCAPSLASAVTETARVKAEASEQDVYERAARVIEMAILQGTTLMRSFVELDPRAGTRGFDALMRLKRDYAWAVEIQICAFAQEGLSNEPKTEPLLVHALENGADLVGGCPYRDPDPRGHVRRILDLAESFGTHADFHVDFDLDPDGSDLPAIAAETERRGMQGRVVVGHATKLSAMTLKAVDRTGRMLADAGIGVVALPSTDLFLTGREAERLVPRGLAPLERLAAAGVQTALASNNIQNPFTPYGDANALRMANLYANLAHLASDAELATCFDRVAGGAAALIGRPRALTVGAPADIVLLDASEPAAAVRGLAEPRAGWRNGTQTFRRPEARLMRPGGARDEPGDQYR
ncbi:amidohydrolase family protein [Allosediminivita pacifica]|uniref:Cytosine deaminase n=1 Tax=Allosediminivita pacifica TaxID=1267769 RepID=A0A2T6A6G3_9RHOB|nr:amidohydrolase family protein [Allosediminivita pacifica]PTX39376.1 cytosine deaminase [Allosediminivita pacifica]GGB27919.1 amidohydrolase [Allosediminivita pacifica]